MNESFDLDDADPPPPHHQGIAARAMRTAPPRYLHHLNPAQREAVETLDGPLLVLAGAGTGKTRVLTTRLSHILSLGRAWPGQILAVTFTNKAAREMKQRIGEMIGDVVEGMGWLGTFHSVGAKILRRHAELAGLQSGFSILDTSDQLRLLKQLMKLAGIDEKRWPARRLAGLIDGWKNRGLTPRAAAKEPPDGFADNQGAKLYAAYQSRLKVLNAVDFGDLILESFRILQKHPDILENYRRRFKYMLVDEYQDTNVAQYLWLRILAKGNGNICCVGDDDQSIYGWRGAEVDNILRFEADFPGAKVIRLEQNYRSTPHILAAASRLIAHNRNRLGKTLKTDVQDGHKVLVRSHWRDEEEARTVGDDLETLQRRGERLDSAAILVRASFQMRAFEDRFVQLGLPYQVIGGLRFFERAEVRDAIAYLKLIQTPDNDLAFERIVNLPKRGLGEATLQKLHEFARKKQISLDQSARAFLARDDIGARLRVNLSAFVQMVDGWRNRAARLEHTELARLVLDESGYTGMLQASRAPEAPGKLDNLKELVRSMGDFDTLAGFLEHVALVMAADDPGADDKVSIMTLHAAKGLEFDTVFLPGWEEGLFPHQRALDEKGRSGLEEERRLAYVGITRARRRAVISFAQNRRIYNHWQSALPSRFIDELPPAHVEVDGDAMQMENDVSESAVFAPGDYAPPRQKAQRRAHVVKRRMYQAAGQAARVIRDKRRTSRFAPGARIFHQKFGHGAVTSVDGDALVIVFDEAGEKKVRDNFVTLA